MTSQLKELIEALTCGVCNGNGYLGSRAHANDTGHGVDTKSIEIGAACHACKGSGLHDGEGDML